MIRAGDYVLPVPLDDPRPVATCIRVARVVRLLQAVAGRLLAEGVKDSSDEELERCLSGCVAAPRCLDAARRIRQLPGDWTTNLDTLARSAA